MRRILIGLLGSALLCAVAATAGASESKQLGEASKQAATNAKQSSTGSGQSASRLKRFTSADGRFSVLMPGTPTASTDQVTIGSGDSARTAPLYEFILTVGDGNVGYMVSYNDYPPDVDVGAAQAVLERGRNGAVGSKTLLTDTPVELNGVPGRSFTYRDTDGGTFAQREYFAGRRLYQLITFAAKGYTVTDLDAFMNSFTITDVSDMQEFDSAEGRFSILMPGVPKADSQQVALTNDTPARTATLYYFVVSQQNDNISYMVLYNDYPPDLANDAPEAVLQRARDGATEGKTLLTDTAVSLNGVPGRAYTYRDSDGTTFDVHQYLAGRRLYDVMVVTNKNYTAADRDAFMNSFVIK
ncbi:MAG TPA: hypothetical protein VEH50_03750 [Methylomirabilota bacterium]|nr:hypothetical protein [Methylomirabilota bacterium]